MMNRWPVLGLLAVGCGDSQTVGSEHTTEWPDGLAPCHPTAADICNGRDDDCDGAIDEDDVCADRCRAVKLGSRQCAIRADGALLCWGEEAGSGDGYEQSTPFHVSIPEPVVQVGRPCARTVSGQVYCWAGALAQAGAYALPRRADGLGNTAAAVVASQFNYLDERDQICAIGAGPWAGTVWCWRGGGHPAGPTRLVGLGDDVVEVATAQRACARKRGGDVWCSRPGDPWSPFAPLTALGTDNVALTLYSHVCVLKSAGDVVCLEEAIPCPHPRFHCSHLNVSGQLGTGSTDAPAGPVLAVALGEGVRQVAAGHEVTCVVTSAGAAACVGADPLRAVPAFLRGPAPPALQPVTPRGLERDVEEVVPYCARKGDGSVWCWGELPGDGSRRSAVPVRVDLCRGVRS